MIPLVAAVSVGLGLALLTMALLQRTRERDDELSLILHLPFGERDVAVEAVTESRAFLERGVSFAHEGLEHLNLMVRVKDGLERARLPLRPGEFVLAAAGFGVGFGVLSWLLTAQALLGAMAGLGTPFVAWQYVRFRAGRRRRAFEAQLPEALSIIASSLQAGHTALRSVQTMVEESEPPLSQEFERVVAETVLGDPLVDALERLANRLELPDLRWVVQAIRIQQTVGGKLADLLHTLAEFMRAREEIRREVKTLTAEGQISAWFLGALPVVVFGAVMVMSPGYMNPMLKGPGLIALALAGVSTVFGIFVILRMVRIDI